MCVSLHFSLAAVDLSVTAVTEDDDAREHFIRLLHNSVLLSLHLRILLFKIPISMIHC